MSEQEIIKTPRFQTGSLKTGLFCLGLALFLACAGHSIQATAANEDGDYELQIKPRVCVTLNSDEPCSMELDIYWSATIPSSVCLRTGNTGPRLRCWQQSLQGEMTMRYASAEDYLFQLLNANSELVLAEAEITVVTRDMRNLRRRSRHVWSIL